MDSGHIPDHIQACLRRTFALHLGLQSSLPLALQGQFADIAEWLSMPAKAVMQEGGKIIHWVYFLIAGVAIASRDIDNGDTNSRTALFLIRANDFVLPMAPPGEHAASPLHIELATDAEVLRVPYASYAAWLQRDPPAAHFDHAYRLHAELSRLDEQALLKTMRTVTARLVWLLQQWPECFAVLPDQAIGDILGGFTRESVCKAKPQALELYRQWRKRANL